VKYLLDTNVVSELRKIRSGRADAAVTAWAASVDSNHLYLCVITLQELKIGLLLAEKKDPIKAKVLQQWLPESVLSAFKNRILTLDVNAAFLSAEFNVPDPVSYRDGFIAAIAKSNGMTVATRNTKDFERTGVSVFNPWLFD
jgi:toxin FitB